MRRIPPTPPTAFSATPIAITPGTDVYGAMPNKAKAAARRFLETDSDYVDWAKKNSPAVAAAVELTGGGSTTLAFFRRTAEDLIKLRPAALQNAWKQRRRTAELEARERQDRAEFEARLAPVRQKNAERQAKLLAIKARAPEWLRDELILVPGGLFMMGRNDHPYQSHPAHPVWVSAYLMLSTHVTNAMWKAKMGTDAAAKYGDAFTPDDHPVVGVDRDDALAYLNQVQEELKESGVEAQVLLPTEAQWERAAKADRNFTHGTDDGTLSEKNAIYYPKPNNHRHTGAVKSRPANPLGFYGLCGNAWDMCRDGWMRVYDSNLQIDPMKPVLTESYALRGGAWDTLDGPFQMTAFYRFQSEVALSSNRYRTDLASPKSFHNLSFRFVIELMD